MRDSSTGNFFLVDKAAIQFLSETKGRPFSRFEAYCSFAMDINCGKKWTISGYSRQWTWTRNKVRRFTEKLLSTGGHFADRKRTGSGHPIHVIQRGISSEADTLRTGSGQEADTTIRIEKKRIKSSAKDTQNDTNFDVFWKEYPNKKNKKKAREIWNRRNLGNGWFEKILSSLVVFKKSDKWNKDGGEYVPMPTTWLNGDRWEDEIENKTDEMFCNSCSNFCLPGAPNHCHQNGASIACSKHEVKQNG